jgi:beta-glucuronidase
MPDPRVWSPARPYLYNVNLRASAGGRTVGSYRLKTGIRSIRVSGDGRLILNGQQVNLRGVGVHEDSRQQGFAVDNAFRERLVAETKAVGATAMRTHYPMHPYTHELADREGVMIWSEVPVYAIKTSNLAKNLVTTLAAKELEKNIIANQNHPSVFVWSIANELSSRPGPTQANYIKNAVRQAKALDPSRPVGIAVAGYPAVGCQKAYAPLDIIGINEYFGWYPGPQGSIFDRTKLSAYLDRVRGCYPRKAVMVTEFGAEANRDGPVEEKGTWAFQQDFVNFHLGTYATKGWLSGAMYWALNEFKVRPGWEGGNPRPNPPIHQKGLLRYGDFARKPAWEDLRRNYAATKQFG